MRLATRTLYSFAMEPHNGLGVPAGAGSHARQPRVGPGAERGSWGPASEGAGGPRPPSGRGSERSVDLNALKVFLAVAQERSFSRAAAKVHRTQPAVSQAVRRLVAGLGEQLFDRSSKNGTLTE